jgi:hypothetical protein
MQVNSMRKTHTLLLVMAVAITVFSLLLSAAITGLIPNTFFGPDTAKAQNRSMQQQSGAKSATLPAKQLANAGNVFDGEKNSTYILGYKSRVQPKVQLSPVDDNDVACANCGTIVSIDTAEKSASGYIIKVRMANGDFRTVTQYSQPDFNVGDEVKVSSRKYTLA